MWKPIGSDAEIVAPRRRFRARSASHGGDAFDSAGFLVRYNLCCGGGCDPCGGSDCGSCGGEGCATDPCSHELLPHRFPLRLPALRFERRPDDPRKSRRPHAGRQSFIPKSSTISTPHNDFNGAELGLNTELRRGRWSLNILTKMAFGTNHQTTNINGTTAFTDLNGVLPPSNFPVGIYAGPTNSGTYHARHFRRDSAIGLGTRLSSHQLHAGLFRLQPLVLGQRDAGRQTRSIRTSIREIGPSAQDAANALPSPQYPNRSSNFWAQGINLGLEVRF